MDTSNKSSENISDLEAAYRKVKEDIFKGFKDKNDKNYISYADEARKHNQSTTEYLEGYFSETSDAFNENSSTYFLKIAKEKPAVAKGLLEDPNWIEENVGKVNTDFINVANRIIAYYEKEKRAFQFKQKIPAPPPKTAAAETRKPSPYQQVITRNPYQKIIRSDQTSTNVPQGVSTPPARPAPPNQVTPAKTPTGATAIRQPGGLDLEKAKQAYAAISDVMRQNAAATPTQIISPTVSPSPYAQLSAVMKVNREAYAQEANKIMLATTLKDFDEAVKAYSNDRQVQDFIKYIKIDKPNRNDINQWLTNHELLKDNPKLILLNAIASRLTGLLLTVKPAITTTPQNLIFDKFQKIGEKLRNLGRKEGMGPFEEKPQFDGSIETLRQRIDKDAMNFCGAMNTADFDRYYADNDFGSGIEQRYINPLKDAIGKINENPKLTSQMKYDEILKEIQKVNSGISEQAYDNQKMKKDLLTMISGWRDLALSLKPDEPKGTKQKI